MGERGKEAASKETEEDKGDSRVICYGCAEPIGCPVCHSKCQWAVSTRRVSSNRSLSQTTTHMASDIAPTPLTNRVYAGSRTGLSGRPQSRNVRCPKLSTKRDSQTVGLSKASLSRGGCVRERAKKASVTKARTTNPTARQLYKQKGILLFRLLVDQDYPLIRMVQPNPTAGNKNLVAIGNTIPVTQLPAA